MLNPSSPQQPGELSLDEVRHIATLARLGMTDAELEKFRGELAGILAHFHVLAAIDTTDVEPTNNGVDLVNVIAPDRPRPSAGLDDVFANATTVEDGLFRVRAVLE